MPTAGTPIASSSSPTRRWRISGRPCRAARRCWTTGASASPPTRRSTPPRPPSSSGAWPGGCPRTGRRRCRPTGLTTRRGRGNEPPRRGKRATPAAPRPARPVVCGGTQGWGGRGGAAPTPQPVEHYAALRAMPNLWFVRPGDPNETVAAWRLAAERRDGPVALALAPQKLPVPAGTAEMAVEGLRRGGYVLADAVDGLGNPATPDVILIATRSGPRAAAAARH